MIRWMIDRGVRGFEEQTGESAEYMRDVAAESLPAFVKLQLMMPLARHRKQASVEALAVARLVATRHEDCGPCVRIVIALAREEGVEMSLLEDAFYGRVELLGSPLDLVYRLAEAVAAGQPEVAELSDQVASALGGEALVEIAMAIATARVFPTVKRALGHARSCSALDFRSAES